MTQEALKLLQEALAGLKDVEKQVRELVAENKALKEALAQPEPCDMKDMCIGCSPRNADGSCPDAQQEPVAWMNDSTPSGIFARHIDGARNFGCTIPLYTTPPPRKPLTDEQIDEIYFKSSLEVDNRCEDIYDFVRAIEAAHNIKE